MFIGLFYSSWCICRNDKFLIFVLEKCDYVYVYLKYSLNNMNMSVFNFMILIFKMDIKSMLLFMFVIIWLMNKMI